METHSHPLLQHTIFINLDHRVDRRECTEKELAKIHIREPERFAAISNDISGAIGCSMSHIACLEKAIQRNYPWVFICEDDIHFTDPDVLLQSLDLFYKNFVLHPQRKWSVLLIAANNAGPVCFYPHCCIPQKKNQPFVVQIQRCFTTTGYIVHQSYYKELLDNMREGVSLLLREYAQNKMAPPSVGLNLHALDVYWMKLQRKDTWYLLVPLTVSQYAGQSDICKESVDYDSLMLELKTVPQRVSIPRMQFL